MKNKIIILASIIFATAILFLACEDDFDKPPIDTVNPDMVLSIADIYQIQLDSGDNYVFTDDYMLYATVIMNDDAGNIYKEAYLQDSTGGINLYKISHSGALEIGDYIRINLNGVEIVDYSGKMELIFADILDFGKSMIVQESNVPIEPVSVTIEDIETGDYNCKLVRLTDVQFAASDTSMTFADMNGTSSQNRNAEDCSGKTILVRSSDYSDFAGDSIPRGKGDMIAVATKFQYSGGDVVWQLLIRSTDELNLNGLRCNETE